MTNTKKRVRSVETPGAPKTNPGGFPYGTGSIQVRGRVWWMIYRDVEGRTIQENARTEDINEARKALAARALETMRAKVAALEAILNDETDGQIRGAGTGVGLDASRPRSAKALAQNSRTRGGKR